MKFAINVQMVQLAMALACTLFLEPASGRAVVGGQARRDLSAGDDHGHGHIHEIASTDGFAPRDFGTHHYGQDDHDHIPETIYKRAPPRKTVPQRTVPQNRKVPVRTQPKNQLPRKKVTQQTTNQSGTKKTTQQTNNQPKKDKPQTVPNPKTDPKTNPPKNPPPNKSKCATRTPSKTGPGKTTPQKKKTGIRSLWHALTRRVTQTPGSSTTGGTGTDTKTGTTDDTCPAPGPSTVFKADCGVDLEVAALGIEPITEDLVEQLAPDDGDSLTSDFEDLGLEDFFKIEDFPETALSTINLEGRCVTNLDASRVRAINFKCNDGTGTGNVPGTQKQYAYSWPVWPHPTPNDFFTKPECNRQQWGWFVDTAKAAGAQSCVNPDMMSKTGKWGLKKKAIITTPQEVLKDYHTEHVYELNFLGNFFKYLNEKEGVTCENLDKYLFRKSRAIAANIKTPRGTENRLVYMLINELGSEVNMQRLAVLDGSVNTLKYNILAERIQNPINIAKFKTSHLNQKMTAFRRVCMVMEYLTMTSAVFKETKDAIEVKLGRFDTAIGKLDVTPSPLPAGVRLKTAHHEFITHLITNGNNKAKTSIDKMLPEIIADKDFKKLDAGVQKIFTDFKTKGVRSFLTSFDAPVAAF